MLPGWCCIAIAALKLGNGDSWYHMCAFRFHFWSRKVNWNQASHVRASPVPTLYACCLTKRSCHFCSLHGSAFAVDFAILRSHFWYRQTVPKMRPWKSFSFVFLLSGALGPKNGTARAVPFLGPCLGSFFEVCCIKVAEAQRFGFNEALWLMAAGRATRGALLSEAGFEKVFRTQNWVRRRKLFCRWFGFLLGQAGVHIGSCLNPVEGSFLLFRFVWWLDCLLLKEGASAFCSLRWLLEVFLAVEEFAGFRKGGRLPFEWLYWILYCPLLAPLAPLDSYRSLQPRKNINYDLFSQPRY